MFALASLTTWIPPVRGILKSTTKIAHRYMPYQSKSVVKRPEKATVCDNRPALSDLGMYVDFPGDNRWVSALCLDLPAGLVKP